MYSILLSLQACASLGLIGREASLMSVSPRQKRLNPPPVPEIPTITLEPIWPLASSETASVIGKTVLDPSTLINLGSACTVETVKPTAHIDAKNNCIIFIILFLLISILII